MYCASRLAVRLRVSDMSKESRLNWHSVIIDGTLRCQRAKGLPKAEVGRGGYVRNQWIATPSSREGEYYSCPWISSDWRRKVGQIRKFLISGRTVLIDVRLHRIGQKRQSLAGSPIHSTAFWCRAIKFTLANTTCDIASLSLSRFSARRGGWGRASSTAPSVFEIKTCSLQLLGASEDARPQPQHTTLREHADRVGES